MSTHSGCTPIRAEAPPRVFISYARSDGKDFAEKLYHCLSDRHGFNVWQDIVDLEAGGETWWLQIENAIKSVEYLVLVLTSAAARSANVVKEWRFARQEGVCVLPIKADPKLDLERLPRWIRKQQFVLPKIREQRARFIHTLESTCQVPRVPFMFGGLLPNVVERPAEFEELLSLLLDQTRQEPVAITAGLRSLGGYGKTVLASAICLNDDIRNAFGDGILWVTLGESITEQDVLQCILNLIESLSDKRPGFTSIDPAKTRLAELLGDREMLIVIDDVWHRAHLAPFLQGGPNCARLITTRDRKVASEARIVDVDAMQLDESIKLLCMELEESSLNREALEPLANRLGKWPQLLSMVNAVLRDRVSDGETLADALTYVNAALSENGLEAFDEEEEGRYRAVGITLNLSFKRLKEDERERFLDLAVFPENVEIPIATVQRLWNSADVQYTNTRAHSLCDKLYHLSLLRNRNLGPKATVTLQDVIRTYLIQQQSSQLLSIHCRLLDAHRPAADQPQTHDPTTWPDLPITEEYLWDHLSYHLAEAGRKEELLSTIKNWRYLAKKLRLRNALAVTADIQKTLQIAPDDDSLPRLVRALTNTEPAFKGLNQDEIEATIFSRLWHLKGSLLEMPEDLPSLKYPYLRLKFDFPDLRRPPSVESQSEEGEAVDSCCYSSVRNFFVSSSPNNGLQVWNPETGEIIFQFRGDPSDTLTGCAVSPDGTQIVCAIGHTLCVWDVCVQEFTSVLDAHQDQVNGSAFSADGRRLVSASSDRTLIIWNTETWTLVRRLVRKTDGEWVDSELGRKWEETEVRVDGHEAEVTACAFSPDGNFLVSASADNSLKIWDVESGQADSLREHSGEVNACVFSHDGSSLVSASSDRTLRIWSVETGATLGVLEGHSDSVNGCDFSSDGRMIVSASSDGTVRVWDVVSRNCIASFYDKGEMYCCQIMDSLIVAGGAHGLYFLELVLDGAQTRQVRLT